MIIFGTHFETLPLIALIIFAISFIVLMLYYGMHHLRVALYKNDKNRKQDNDNNAKPSVSIVLTVKNDEIFLSDNLTYLLEQEYPDFEVIVVDYASTDGTQYVLQVYKENYGDRLKIVRFPDENPMYRGKKYPLAIGIQSAKNDIIVLTDVDCIPNGFNWVSEMAGPFANPRTDIVIGYCGYNRNGTVLNDFIQFENLQSMGSIFGKTLMHHPYSAHGQNMAYRRDFFFKSNGFIKHYNIPAGDDDLFINQNATRKNTSIRTTKESFVKTNSKDNFSLWHSQRCERSISRSHFKFSDKLLISAYPTFVLLFYLFGALSYIAMPLPVLGFCILGVLAVKLTWQIICFYQMCRYFETQKHISFLSPLFEIYFMFANTFLSITTLRHKKSRWK